MSQEEGGDKSSERESVEEVLKIVGTYGPWGTDINESLRYQIVLADEVKRLQIARAAFSRDASELQHELDELRASLSSVAAPDGYAVVMEGGEGPFVGCYRMRQIADQACARQPAGHGDVVLPVYFARSATAESGCIPVPIRFLADFIKAIDFHNGHGTPSFDRVQAHALHAEAVSRLATHGYVSHKGSKT